MKAVLDKPAEEAPSIGSDFAMHAGNASSPSFHSILFEGVADGNAERAAEAPAFFRDLNLDQIVDAITAGREEYNLRPLFHTRLKNPAAIAYRHEIMRDLEDEVLFQSIRSFSAEMRRMRQHLSVAGKLSYKYEKERWFLEAVEIYETAIDELRGDLEQLPPHSRGLLAFRSYLAHYADSGSFKTLLRDTRKLKSELSAIKYCLLIHGSSVTVRNYDSEIDYSAVVEEAFAKFKQGAVKDNRVKFSAVTGLNHVEGMVLERVALLNPAVFLALDEFCARNKTFADKTIVAFDQEIQFYIAWLEYAQTFQRAGLKFCYPHVSETCKKVCNREGFDLALAGKLIGEGSTIVCNDFELSGDERILVVTGPNQGGKTTFARTFGQLHYLASLGCLVPGTEAQLFLCHQLLTHFEREEDIATLRGKLQDDLVRIHRTLEEATPNSLIIINEIFSSTTLKDAVFLSRNIIEDLSALDALCVCVTFVDELASLNAKTVSMVAQIVPDNPTLRTYKLERKPADGLAYALAIAEKYQLTNERLKERLDKS